MRASAAGPDAEAGNSAALARGAAAAPEARSNHRPRRRYIPDMSVSAQRSLHKAITTGSFDRAYLLWGDDDFLKESAAKQIVDKAVDPATRDFNLDVRRAAELDAGALDSLLSTPPMMAERRVVVLRDVGGMKKPARAALDRYLERPAEDAVLVLVAAGGGAKVDKGLQGKTTAVEFAPLSGERVPKWIAHHARTELGVEISEGAIELLQSAVGDDLAQLSSELDKLSSYTSGAEIDEAAVSAVVGIRRGETLGDLLDRVAERDAARALPLVEHVLSQPKTTAVSVVMALSAQTLALAYGRAQRANGVPASRMEGTFFNLLRETKGGVTGRPWGEATRAWARTVDRWNERDLDRALQSLLAADMTLKESRLSSDEQVIRSLILSLCVSH
jgi:DNA polymerase III subunit delta